MYHSRHVYTYRSVNEPIAASRFRPPADDGIARQELDPLGEGYDRRFLNARDGSDGRMSVRWGKKGTAGWYSSGLN